MKYVDVHDTIRVSSVNDRYDSVVYIYRNDTVKIDRWHNRTKVDTVYKYNTEYVHDTVRVETKVETKGSDHKWTLKDDLRAFLIGMVISALIALGAKIGYTIKYK